MTTPVPGDVVAGKYRVERVLGSGGMGIVVAARHVVLDQRVAIKFLRPDVASNAEIVTRFAREARAAVRIQSEHVARVIDVGELPGGAPFMVMEYLEGADLGEVLQKRGALPVGEAVEYLLQACEALAEAHVGGVVHRDLKPANLFLTQRADGSPVVKVLDFGISKALHGDAVVTQTQALVGSPRYMSPEQLRSPRDVDARSDVWSLGIILFELLTGEAPFRADTVPQLYVNILSQSPDSLRIRRPDIPPPVEAILLRCLEKEVSRRFSNVGELARALGDFAPPRARVSIERISKVIAGLRVAPTLYDPQEAQPPVIAPTTPSAAPPTAPMAQPGWGVVSVAQPHAVPAFTPHSGPQHAQYPGPHAHQQGPPQYAGAPMAPYGGPPPAYPPQGYGPPAAPPSQGLHPAWIVLITLVILFAAGLGGCFLCVCATAASAPSAASPSQSVPVGLGSDPVLFAPRAPSAVQLAAFATGDDCALRRADEAPSRRRALVDLRAHSSIGQSPRLITGLFLVRTQVGPRSRRGGRPLPRPPRGRAPAPLSRSSRRRRKTRT